MFSDGTHCLIACSFHNSDVLWRLVGKLTQAALEQVDYVKVVVWKTVTDYDHTLGSAQRLFR
jgi:hypothetical protein